MKNKHLLFLLLCCFSWNSCNNKKTDYKLLAHSSLNSSNEYLGSGGAIIAYNNGIIGIEEASSLPPFFTVKTNNKDSHFFHFGNRGQGLDDFIRPYPIQYLDDNTFGVYDMASKTYKEVYIAENGDSILIKNRIALESQPFIALKTAYDQYIGLSFKDGLLTLADKTVEDIKFIY